VSPPPPPDAAPPPPPPPACLPASADTRQGGGRCADLNEAWTARGINVGYYPFRVVAPIEQYSGDFDGDPAVLFERGAGRAGVVLQVVPPGSYVALSSNGPWYDPPAECLTNAEPCGDPGRAACRDDSPPLRPDRAGFRWGYAYQGASHMQGWFFFDPAKLEFAGFDPGHPCALGPAGADYEATSACGQAMACRGRNPSCGQVNRCDEGADDCGRQACGAESGGALTPSAHRRRVARPDRTAGCVREPPHPSVRCLPNGSEIDFFFVYPFGAYMYWAPNSTTKFWLHYGDRVQTYYHARDAQGVLWDFVEVIESGAPVLTPASDGSGAAAPCSADRPDACRPCANGGACGWIQDVFLD
jgi:hypothetical protein